MGPERGLTCFCSASPPPCPLSPCKGMSHHPQHARSITLRVTVPVYAHSLSLFESCQLSSGLQQPVLLFHQDELVHYRSSCQIAINLVNAVPRLPIISS